MEVIIVNGEGAEILRLFSEFLGRLAL